MEQKYEVTIGIPVYNVEKYIRQSMDSVLAQTFNSIEVLICDDCGTDSSIAIIEEYQKTHSRGKDIRIVRQPYNKGIGEGRNRIIDEVKGKYLYFMDADDTIAPNTIQLLYENAQRYNAEIVYGSYERIEMLGDNVKHIPRQYAPMQFLNEDEFASWAYDAYDNLPAMTWNFLIDINIFHKNGLRYQPVSYWEDFSITIDLPTYITRAVLLSDITYHYFCHYNSASKFQHRNYIAKQEILKTIDAMAVVKNNSERLKGKPYSHKHIYKVMKTHFYMVCSILKNEKVISPAFTKREIRDVMIFPLSLCDILNLKGWKLRNLALCLLGMLPPGVSIALMRMVVGGRRFRKYFVGIRKVSDR